MATSKIARSRVPCGRRSMRARRSARFLKPCAMTRLNRPFAGAAVRETHARVPCEQLFAWSARARAICE
eukprot:2795688-Lingulodinium_polyedra.AAC.1